MRPIVDGSADVVYGSRYMPGNLRRVHPYWHTLVNKTITMLCNMVTNNDFTDVETCYKAFRKEVIKGMSIETNGFAMDIEITVKATRMTKRIYEVPVSYVGRTFAAGKKIIWTDGVMAMVALLKFGLGRY